MSNTPKERYSIGELADAGGVSRRTVRYYVQRGLLSPPTGLGRSAHYDAAHLARLIRVRQLQQAGVPLEEIAARLDDVPLADSGPRPGVAPAHRAAPATRWQRLTLADGVELSVRDGALDPTTLDALMKAIGESLVPPTKEHDDVQ